VFTGSTFAQSVFEITKALAEKGDATAQYSLGKMYGNGKGIPQNDVEAVK